jgi:Fic-DOC domain mobile mystery protein B
VQEIFDFNPVAAVPGPLWHTRFNNFAPRIGAAYSTNQTDLALRRRFNLAAFEIAKSNPRPRLGWLRAIREWALNPRRVKARDPFTEPYLHELHRRMFNHTWKWAGTYRNTEKNIGVLVHEIRNRIPALLGNTRYWVDHQTFPADEIAIRFHHELVGVIQPFPNGNGRHARLHADVVAVKLDRSEFTWGQNSIVGTGPAREAYTRALRAADNGDIQELLKFARS